MVFKSTSPAFTQKIAARLARKITKTNSKNALVVGLTGKLGAGKTNFIQGFAKELKIRERLTSPTFVISRNYALKLKNYKKLFHVDAYRLKNSKEVKILNFKPEIENSENIILIEWAEKIKKILPQKTIWINFEHGKKENERVIKIPKFRNYTWQTSTLEIYFEQFLGGLTILTEGG